MTAQVQEKLRNLKLTGLLDSLEIRARQAEENKLAYNEFLSLLLQDEMERRNSKSITEIIRKAGFGEQKTFEEFDFRFNENQISQSLVRELATCNFIRQGRNVLISGPPGIGKTHIAKAIGHEACRKRFSVIFSKTYMLLEHLQSDLSQKTLMKTWKKITSTSLLIFDDFGFRKMTSKEAELFYGLVDERLSKGSMIITSNRPAEDWHGIFPDPVIGGAILDRLASDSFKIIIKNAKSFRKEGKKKGDLQISKEV